MSAANLDTSVLVDYLLLNLAVRLGIDGLRADVSEPSATDSLFSDGTRHLVIGGKVDEEFSALCDRHRAIYQDVLDWAYDNLDGDLDNYDLSERDVRATANDTALFSGKINYNWSGTPTPEQLSRFRQLKQEIRTVEVEIHRRLDSEYDQFDDPSLTSELSDLGLGHDTDVVVDAVEIADDHGIDLLVSVDDGLTNNESELNNRIRAAGHTVSLRVARPSDA